MLTMTDQPLGDSDVSGATSKAAAEIGQQAASDAESRLGRIVELFETNANAVYNVAYRIVWNRADAEDVVQATFVQVFLKLHQLQDQTKVRGWLLQIAYRQSLTVIRRRRDQPTDPADLPDRATSHDATAAPVLQSELTRTIRAAIDQLPQNLRLALVLRDVEALPMAEVATVLDIGPSAAKMRVARARQQLRTELAGKI